METDTEIISIAATLKELHAYAKLLYLRDGRQFKDKTFYEEVEDEVSSNDSRNDDSSSKNVSLGNLDTDHLRRRFLDRLSEIVSPMKGGRHVVASYMFYWPDKVKVFLAINSGFVEGDAVSTFLDTLCKSLKGIAMAPDYEIEKSRNALWNLVLCHQSSRLTTTIVDLRQVMKSFPHLPTQRAGSDPSSNDIVLDIDGSMLAFEDCLKLLAQLLFNSVDSDLKRHSDLVNLSYALYRKFRVDKFQTLGRQGEKLRNMIGFLGRLQMSFQDLVTAASQIPGFDDLFLIPVIKPRLEKNTPNEEWSLIRTLGALKVQVNDTAIEKLMETSNRRIKWTKNKLISDFSRIKSPSWEVHAEIQLIAFTLGHPNDIANGKGFEYIGCSRYTCLLCSKFLDHWQGLKTRGCHGKLYNESWTIPRGDSLGKNEQQALHSAAMGVISWMRKELIGSMMLPARRIPQVKESTVGGSSISMPGTSQGGLHQNFATSEYLHRQRTQNNRMPCNQKSLPGSVEDGHFPRPEVQSSTLLISTEKTCIRCLEETTRRCSHCGEGLFCNENCERKMPLSHLLKCNMRQVTSADYLFEDVLDDMIPTDPQVLEDYWFDRCHNPNEKSHLLGLFAGLLLHHPDHISRETLHQWRSEPGGNPYLVAQIVVKFEELPKGSAGGYFPWFFRHRKRFELAGGHESIPQAPTPEMHVQNMQAKARRYLAVEDQNKDFRDLTPFSKMHCFAFYSIVIGNQHPPPMNQADCFWFDFGFVVCRDQYEEASLGGMYNTMLFGSRSQLEYEESLGSSSSARLVKKRDPACTFDEFWTAWDKGKLMAIFDKCWPELQTRHTHEPTEYRILKRLRRFIESETPRPSIWKLRHFLALDNVSVESAVPDIAWAAREYGFSESLDTRMTLELRNFYVQLFNKAEPMEIYCERIKGNLVQFAERHVGSSPLGIRELLQGL